MTITIPFGIALIILIISIARAVWTGEIWGASYICFVAIAVSLILGNGRP